MPQFNFPFLTNEPLVKHTTLGIGGPADFYAEVQNTVQLIALLQWAREKNSPVFFIGNGSNLLVSDQGLRGCVVHLRGNFESFSVEGTHVQAGSGILLPTLIKQCAQQGLGGAEPLVGIPGTLGGALVMNAGTPALEIGSLVEEVTVLTPDFQTEKIPASRIQFQYRFSSLFDKMIVSLILKESWRSNV